MNLKRFKNPILKLVIIIYCLILSNCADQNYPDDEGLPTPNGYNFTIESAPTNYDPATGLPLKVVVRPTINPSTGFGTYRLFFRLNYGGEEIGQSNFVYFNHNTQNATDDKTLEWGGSGDFDFPGSSAEITLKVSMQKFAYLDFPDENAELVVAPIRKTVNLTFLEFDESQILETLIVEYDQEVDSHVWDEILHSEVNSVFDPCLKSVDFRDRLSPGNNVDIAFTYPEISLEYTLENLHDLVWVNRDLFNAENIYLMSIPSFYDSQGNVDMTTLGSTINDDELGFWWGSILCYDVFVDFAKPMHNLELPESFGQKYTTKTVVHEMGHQISLRGLPDDHITHTDGLFCCMYQGISAQLNYQGIIGRSLFDNIYFCKRHVDLLK